MDRIKEIRKEKKITLSLLIVGLCINFLSYGMQQSNPPIASSQSSSSSPRPVRKTKELEEGVFTKKSVLREIFSSKSKSVLLNIKNSTAFNLEIEIDDHNYTKTIKPGNSISESFSLVPVTVNLSTLKADILRYRDIILELEMFRKENPDLATTDFTARLYNTNQVNPIDKDESVESNDNYIVNVDIADNITDSTLSLGTIKKEAKGSSILRRKEEQTGSKIIQRTKK